MVQRFSIKLGASTKGSEVKEEDTDSDEHCYEEEEGEEEAEESDQEVDPEDPSHFAISPGGSSSLY